MGISIKLGDLLVRFVALDAESHRIDFGEDVLGSVQFVSPVVRFSEHVEKMVIVDSDVVKTTDSCPELTHIFSVDELFDSNGLLFINDAFTDVELLEV